MVILILFLVGLLLLVGIRLHLYQKQIRELARQLQELSPESNQRLTCFLRDRDTVSLCSEMNQYMDARQQSVLQAREAEKELKYTMASVSHDIRTPLTGAAGYMQLLEKSIDGKKQKEYCRIIRQRLGDLEQLLDELFLYTRLVSSEFPINCEPVRLLPLLCQVLTEFYQQFQEKGWEPQISFEDETIEILGDAQQLRRVFGNFISNALAHGKGNLYIEQKGDSLLFKNQVENPEKVQVEVLFQRFYRGDKARQGAHAGLGLSIARELLERMDGTIQGELEGDMLCIKMKFSVEKRKDREKENEL